MRGFSSPIMIRNISNNVDNETTKTLLDVCKKNSKIFQKYFLQKAKLLGMRKLRRYDLYAPGKSKIKEKNYAYDKPVKFTNTYGVIFGEGVLQNAPTVFPGRIIESTCFFLNTLSAYSDKTGLNFASVSKTNFTDLSYA